MQDKQSGSNKAATEKSPARGIQTECSVLFVYALDAGGRPEIWEVRLVSDKDCGTRLETFRRNADSNGKFVKAIPENNRLERIYKVQIQDDVEGFCPPLDDYSDCLFLLETVPARRFEAGSITVDLTLDFDAFKTHCGTAFRAFDARLLLSPLVAPFGRALWRFKAEIPKTSASVAWKKFSFSGRAADSVGHVNENEVDFLKPGQQRLRNSLEAALTDTEQTPGRQWEFPIDNTARPGEAKILSHLSSVLESFPTKNGGSTVDQGQGFKVGLVLFSVLGKDAKNQVTLKILSLPAGQGKSLGACSILDYRSLSAGNSQLLSLRAPDSAELRLVAQPHPTLSPGPQTTGNPQNPDYSQPYSPDRKNVLEFHSIPTRSFIQFWNSQVGRQLDALKLVQGGDPVSFVPVLNESADARDRYAWILAYEVQDASSTDAPYIYPFAAPRSAKAPSSSFIELMSMRAGKLSNADNASIPLSVSIPNVNPIHLRTGLDSLKTFVSVPPSAYDPLKRGVYFEFATPIFGDGSAGDPRAFQIRMGAFDLTIQRTEPDRDSGLSGAIDFTSKGQPVIDVNLKIAMSDCSPGGQDYSPAEEYSPPNSKWIPSSSRCEGGVLVHRGFVEPGLVESPGTGPGYEAMFDEEAPLTIYVPPTNRSGKYLLQANETIRDNTSHTLDLYVFNKQPFGGADVSVDVCDQEKNLDTLNRVYVIQRNPFLVAKVAFFPIGANNASTPLAIWTNRADQPRGWQVNLSRDKKSTASPVCLTLPPQGIGETMLDENNKDPNKDPEGIDDFYKRLSSFNYSSPANFHLSVNDEGLTFTAAPWNLHNLLSTRTLAPYVQQIDFELLYGLSCIAEQPLIRLLDTFAIVGQVPARPSPELAWTPVKSELDAVNVYAKFRADWALVYRRLRNRLAVLEPVPQNSSGLDPSVVLQKNLSCWIRLPGASNLQPPQNLALAQSDLPNTDEGRAKYSALQAATLQGGATKGFVSKNVYLASVFNDNATSVQSRVSSGAQLSQFSFTALGGNGRQMAGFQNNLTRIYGDVHLGRAYRYKVERIGRIACFWNVAKHVVVYERRVSPAKQFADPADQLPEVGWPYIRKVEEFVEIIDDKLDFPPAPEPGSNISPEQTADLRRRSACVTGIQFQPGQRFNVRSDWGIDVDTWGWKIPLWDRSEGFRNQEVYPEPNFHLRLAPHDAQDRAYELKRFRKPEQVFFFTLTKIRKAGGGTEDPDGDPRMWPAQPGIDFVNLPDPVAARDFSGGDSRQYTSPEASCPPGFSPVTFDLEASGPPVNLTEGRNNSAVAVQLATITVSRSVDSARALPPVDWANPAAATDSQFAALRALEGRLTDLFKSLLQAFPVGQVLEPGLGTRIEKKVDELIAKELKDLIDDTTRLKSKLAGGPFNTIAFKNKVGTVEEQALQGVLKRIDDAVAQAKKEMADRIQALKNATSFPADEAKHILLDTGARISETLLLIGSAPGQSARYVAQMTGRLAVYIDEAKAEFPKALQRIRDYAARSQTTLVECQQQLRTEFATLQSAEDDFFRSSSRYLPTGMPDSPAGWRNELSSYFGLFNHQFSAVISATSKPDFVNKLNAVAAPALDDLTDVKRFLGKCSAFATDNASDWAALVGRLNSQITGTYNAITKPWMDAIEAARTKVLNNYNDFDTAFQALLGTVTDASSGIRKTLMDTAQKAKDAADKTSALLDSAFADFETQLNGAGQKLKDIARNLANNIDRMQSEIIRYKDQLVSSAREWAEHCVGPLVDRFNQSGAYQAGDTALRLVRALGDPPRTSQMKFEQSQLGYYFKQALPGVDLSPAYMALDQGAAALEALKPLGLRLPCSQILDQFVPSALKDFDLKSIFPNFAGIDFSNLLPGIKVPDNLGPEAVKVTHGLDREKRRAYAKAEVNFTLDKPATILDIGPVKLSVPTAVFQSSLSIGATQSGIDERQISGSIKGNWALALAGTDLITLGGAALLFNDHGGVHFNIDPTKVQLPDFLKFLTDALNSLVDPDSGLSFGAIPGGFQCVLDLPVPDTSAITSGVSGLSLSANLALLFRDDFTIQVGCAIGKPDKPFNVAFFILGGGGYCFTAVEFTPSTGRFVCLIDLRITASASLSIALGPISGGVYVYLGVTANFTTGGGSSSFGVIFIVRGDVSICGIISAYVALTLSAKYNSQAKNLIGEGRLDMEVKICWCFTFKVHQSVSYTLHVGDSKTAGLGTNQEVLLAYDGDIADLHVGAALNRVRRDAQPEILLAQNRPTVSGSPPPIAAPLNRTISAKDAAHLYSNMLF
jgi:hypothetical protein